jgi:hypothetical protein
MAKSSSRLFMVSLVLAAIAGPSQAEEAEVPQLIPIWTAMADPEGRLDEELDTESAESAEFSPDGSRIVAGSKGVRRDGERFGQRVSMWRSSDGSLLWSHDRVDEVEAVSFSPSGDVVAAGGEDRRTEIRRASDGHLIASLQHDAGIDSLRFSHDGRLLATGSESQHIEIYRSSDWTLVSRVRHGGSGSNAVNQLDFTSNDDRIVSAGSNGKVRVWRVDRSEADGMISDVDLTPLYSIDRAATTKSVRIDPSDRLFASGSGNGKGVQIHDLETGSLVASIPATAWIAETIEFSRDGRFLLTGGNEGEVAGSNDQLEAFPPAAGFGHIRAYAVPEPGHTVFPLVLEQPVFRQEYLHFNSNGDRLVSAHEDGSIRLWEWILTVPEEPLGDVGGAFRESGGLLVMEAEHFTGSASNGDGIAWRSESTLAGFAGSGYVMTPEQDVSRTAWASSAALHYEIEISTAGGYTIWARRSQQPGANSAWLGLDGSQIGDRLDNQDGSGWHWIQHATAVELTAGSHSFELRRREDGYRVDRLLLTTDSTFVPAAAGPPASPRGEEPISEIASIRINFQPSGSSNPSGCWIDAGDVFGDRAEGAAYGWSTRTDDTRDRNRDADQLRDTLNHMQKRGRPSWELAIPDGDYLVSLVCGDSSYTDQVNHLEIEGLAVRDPDGQDHFDAYLAIPVTVTDGRLSVRAASDGSNAKICWIQVDAIESSSAEAVHPGSSGPEHRELPLTTNQGWLWVDPLDRSIHDPLACR